MFGCAFISGTRKGGVHKSVFTFRALREMLEYYGFKVERVEGYTYNDEFYRSLAPHFESVGFNKLRLIMNVLLPVRLKECLLFLCKKS